MSARSSFFAILLAFALTAQVSAQCGKKCNFRLCKQDGTPLSPGSRVILRGPDYAQDPSVCLPGSQLRTIRSTGEALVSTHRKGKRPVQISKFRPAGLKKRYPRSYFQLYPIQFNQGSQGVGRKKSKGNQFDFLDKLCVVLPIESYVVEDESGRARTVNTNDPNDCVGFTATAPAILVELEWDSSADLDIRVIEPDGDELSFGNPRTEAGILNNDLIPECGSGETGKENALYRMGGNIESGEYKVRITQAGDCSERTRWNLRIVVGGKTISSKSGGASPGDSDLFETSFTI